MTKKRFINDDGAKRLAWAIIEQAIRDYKKLLRTNNLAGIESCKCFFLSRWFSALCDISGEAVIAEIERHNTKKNGAARKVQPHNRKAIRGTNIKTGEVVEFPSITAAEKYFGNKNTYIFSALNGEHNTAYGYVWEYL